LTIAALRWSSRTGVGKTTRARPRSWALEDRHSQQEGEVGDGDGWHLLAMVASEGLLAAWPVEVRGTLEMRRQGGGRGHAYLLPRHELSGTRVCRSAARRRQHLSWT
jgi:hypothetical protein